MSTYFCILTSLGAAKMANATALGEVVEFSQMALGDGGGSLPTPDQSQASLVNEVRRAALNSVEIDPDNPTWIVCEQVIPADVGGWTVRETGIYDTDGDLIAVGNFPETYKPVLEEGSGRTQTIRMVIQVSNAATVTLKIDPSVVLATREYADLKDAAHAEAEDPHPQYRDASFLKEGKVPYERLPIVESEGDGEKGKLVVTGYLGTGTVNGSQEEETRVDDFDAILFDDVLNGLHTRTPTNPSNRPPDLLGNLFEAVVRFAKRNPVTGVMNVDFPRAQQSYIRYYAESEPVGWAKVCTSLTTASANDIAGGIIDYKQATPLGLASAKVVSDTVKGTFLDVTFPTYTVGTIYSNSSDFDKIFLITTAAASSGHYDAVQLSKDGVTFYNFGKISTQQGETYPITVPAGWYFRINRAYENLVELGAS